MDVTLSKLTGGDRRSIGRANEVVGAVLQQPALFAHIMRGLSDADPVVRVRCADVAEKVSAIRPDVLRGHAARLIQMAQSPQPELRWHAAQMLPRLALTLTQRERVYSVLFAQLADDSRIVRACALEALADLAQGDPSLRAHVTEALATAAASGSAALKARSRKLLTRCQDWVCA